MSKINVNTVDTQCGSTLTLGSSGKTVTLASGASQSGFGRTGTVDWCTTAKTAPFTSVSGNGYFVNTTSGAVTVTLPASPSAGDIIALKDYANTWDTNSVTVARNGSKINGNCSCAVLETVSQSVTLIYVDATKGWQDIHDSTSDVTGTTFITATGGTITTVCTDFKVHTFTSDGTFCVSAGNGPRATVSYVVVGGGGASGGDRTGAGGAGGYREGKVSTDPYTASPLDSGSGIQLSPGPYSITVGGGGSAINSPPYNATNPPPGSNSVFSSITSAGGGPGGRVSPGGNTGEDGGSGGGGGNLGGASVPGGTGNTPSVTPPQGNNGGASQGPPATGQFATGGGGGAGAAGGDGTGPSGGPAGNGVNTSITGSSTGYAGGGAGANDTPGRQGTPAGPFGGGTAATGDSGTDATSGATNKGGGGGASAGSTNGGSGGSGVVIIRYKFQ